MGTRGLVHTIYNLNKNIQNIKIDPVKFSIYVSEKNLCSFRNVYLDKLISVFQDRLATGKIISLWL